MNLLVSFALVFACATIAQATVKCDGVIFNTINDEVLVDGTSCTFRGATINGPVTVINDGRLIVEDGSTVNGDITSSYAGALIFLGHREKTTINGLVVDEDGQGLVFICDDVVFNRDVEFIYRSGDIKAGVDGCSPSSFTGTAIIAGGEGLTQLDNLKQSPRSLIIDNRRGSVNLNNNAPLNVLEIYDNEYVSIEGMTVYNRADVSGNGIGVDNSVILWDMTVYGSLTVSDSLSIVVMENMNVSSEGTFINNSEGVVSYGGDFNVLDCEGNAEPIVFNGGSVNVGKGQCAGF